MHTDCVYGSRENDQGRIAFCLPLPPPQGGGRRESNGVIYCVNLPMNANRIMEEGGEGALSNRSQVGGDRVKAFPQS